MSIRSGKGDKGFTSFLSQEHISKDSDIIKAIGDLDELNGHLGLVKCRTGSRKNKEILEKIQRTLHVITSEIAVGAPKRKKMGLLLKKEDADWIEGAIGELEGAAEMESRFSLPGENETYAFYDIARAVARRAERNIVGLFRGGKLENDHILTFLNCISDILFIMPRTKVQKKHVRKTKKREKRSKRKG